MYCIMITQNLYQRVLIDPINNGANHLMIVSGYATATMASRHLKSASEMKKRLDISLIVGMSLTDGVEESSHEGFVNLTNNTGSGKFECKYVHKNPSIHSKVYVWCIDDKPISAYVGSANYTQSAFSKNRGEVLVECNPERARDYFLEIEPSTICCEYGEIREYIQLTSRERRRALKKQEDFANKDKERQTLSASKDHIKISLLQRGGIIRERSGLNWGQRDKREPNQAYIPFPTALARTGFFPTDQSHFMVLTDDQKTLILRLEQQGNKAITTPLNNSLLGEYFRNRLGLANGQKILTEDLVRYGRTDIDFFKVDEETYYMDFSV